MTTKEITRRQAIKLYNSNWWKDVSARDIVALQLFNGRLLMDFGDFHAAVEEELGRSVWTHEFCSSNVDNLRAEFLGDAPAPSFEEIVNLIPAEKRVILVTP